MIVMIIVIIFIIVMPIISMTARAHIFSFFELSEGFKMLNIWKRRQLTTFYQLSLYDDDCDARDVIVLQAR